MKALSAIVILLLSTSALVLADDQADRDKLIGTWELQGAAANSPASAWTFSENKSALRVTQIEGTNKIADFECGTLGTACEIKTDGKKATVTMYFNGPWLVQLETRGSDVVKRRFKVSDASGDQMEMEVIPIVPGGNTEKFQYKRAQTSAGR
jgi:hypothetical protein